jgi:flagellar basal-body rod modification protein FlgD
MNGIEGISTAGAQSRGTTAAADREELDQDAFLKLMIAQLQNQDPFKPLDPTEYVGQLAQFSQVSGLQQIETSIAGLTESMRGNQVLDGATLVGRSVLADGNRVRLDAENRAPRGAVEMPEGVGAAQINVRDAGGQLVRTMPLDTTPGVREFAWDGRTNDGSLAPQGTYRFEVLARAGDRSGSLPVQIATRVTSVSIDPRNNALTLNTESLGELQLAQVRRVM